MRNPDNGAATPIESADEIPSHKLLQKCLEEVGKYGKKMGYNPVGAFFALPNEKLVYVTSKPSNMKLNPGEICIGRYDKSMMTQKSVVVTSKEEALEEVKKWGETE